MTARKLSFLERRWIPRLLCTVEAVEVALLATLAIGVSIAPAIAQIAKTGIPSSTYRPYPSPTSYPVFPSGYGNGYGTGYPIAPLGIDPITGWVIDSQLGGYPTGYVLESPGFPRPTRSINNSVLINPTIVNSPIRNSTLVNPTIVTTPGYPAGYSMSYPAGYPSVYPAYPVQPSPYPAPVDRTRFGGQRSLYGF